MPFRQTRGHPRLMAALWALALAGGTGGIAAAQDLATRQTSSPTQTPTILDFRFILPANTELMFLGLSVIGVLLGAYGVYRVLLPGMVRNGVHPTHLRASLWVWALFGIELFAMFLAPGVGQGWFLSLSTLLGLVCILLLVSRTAVTSAVLTLLIALLAMAGLRASALI
ncbi:hypothetical protein [Niveispirillum sp.]|uniref:hypothetical protein n=1 Tax=Niveispirillum sp. TaxID=1917217 RepID=UPI001B55149F|nr:hypothetical protein [Niveispirillum sp.]MBP7335165.1 hypothetical protein [Niveispirillum sp.]